MATKKLILKVVADVKDAKSGLAEVATGIRDMFKGAEGAGQGVVNGTLKAFDGLKGVLDRVAPAASAVLTIAEGAIELSQFAGERERLERQVSTQQLSGLRAATRGLVDDTTLMKSAAQGMRGDFALTQAQLENVAAAAVTLHNQGFGPIPEIVADITEKLRTGEVEGLKKYGFSAGETGTKVEKLGRAHQAMGILATDAANKLTDSSTATTRAMVSMKNGADDAKAAIGAAMPAVGGFLFDAGAAATGTASAFGLLAQRGKDAEEKGLLLASSIDRATAAAQEAITPTRAMAAGGLAAGAAFDAFARAVKIANDNLVDLTTNDAFDTLLINIKQTGEAARKAVDPMFGAITIANQQREAARRAEEAWERAWDLGQEMLANHERFLERIHEEGEGDGRTIFDTMFSNEKAANVHKMVDDIREMNDLLQRSALDNPKAAKDVDTFEQRLGRIVDLQMDAKRAWQDVKFAGVEAFFQVSAAAGKSIQAIISGNDAALGGFKETFKVLLDQLGTEMQINALKYLAMGTAALLTNPPAASGYFIASGIFESAALLAGIAQRGAGSPSAGAGAGAGGGAANSNTAGRDSLSSSSGGQTVVNYNFKIGYGFIGDEKKLAREMHKVTRKAELTGAIRPATGTRRAG